MQKEIIPTAEDLLIKFGADADDMYRKESVEEIMKEFAKLHVEAALKAVHSNMQLDPEDLEFMLDSYPLEKIK